MSGGCWSPTTAETARTPHTMAHVARQYLGSVGKTDNGIVVVCTLWADERVYYPLHVAPYTPAGRLPAGTADPGFATKAQLVLQLARRARTAGYRSRRWWPTV